VAAYRRLNSRIGSTATHHVPDIRAGHRPRPEFLSLADRGAEQRPLAIIRAARRLYVVLTNFQRTSVTLPSWNSIVMSLYL
jgi:hypothetical protein